jgi:hypothetical protein
MDLSTIPISADFDATDVHISEQTQDEILQHAEYYEFTGMMPMLKSIMAVSYDVVSWFTHTNGNKYGVIHTLFGEHYISSFKEKVKKNKWMASICASQTKRKCIQDFLRKHNCDPNYVFCIMDN